MGEKKISRLRSVIDAAVWKPVHAAQQVATLPRTHLILCFHFGAGIKFM